MIDSGFLLDSEKPFPQRKSFRYCYSYENQVEAVIKMPFIT